MWHRETLPANDKAIAQILLEVPALPSPSVGQFLSEVADLGGEWATLALSSARDIIINRPPNRWGFVLELAVVLAGVG